MRKFLPNPTMRAKRVVVGVGGLEPPTLRLSGVRSNHLSYTPPPSDPTSGAKGPAARCAKGAGGAGRDRTDNLKLAKLPLSQLSYGPRCPVAA